ncbi:glycosyltransferase family 4 protein [Methylophaga sp.]|uniref:glycosyltransferase family 4 protein n=1 Tax=Methylophaga sp. TaxID=2024840 RepID=UPI003A8FE0D8
MKILIVNTSDIQGGAARAAYRLHRALLAKGEDSQMLVQSKASDDYKVIGPENKIQKAIGKIRPTLDLIPVRLYKDRTKTLFSPSLLPFSSVLKRINEINPDVVHLHWIAGGMMRTEDLAKIKAPIVWSLHDMWAFTGGCHYDEDCGAYQKECGVCPVLGSNKYQDLSRKILRRKHTTYEKTPNLNIIGVSQWLVDCAKKSSLFAERPIYRLPNPIDTDVFAPFNKQEARSLLNLPQDKKLVLFGAIGATSDPRKGFKELSQALKNVPESHQLVVFGSSEPYTPQGLKQKVHYLGYLHDDVSLRVLYSAADVMVVPSLQEAFGQTATESMACGTPVVAFGATGLLDILDHQLNGYLAKPFETHDLANGINWVLNHPKPEQLAQSAREKIVSVFDSKIVAKKYILLYRDIIHKANTLIAK